jgi:hypothetical protein
MLDSTTNCGVGAFVEISIISVQEARIIVNVITEKKDFIFIFLFRVICFALLELRRY